MAGPHVPKFGNWESDNIPYTVYFENARKEKTRVINPNDPEQNPEAFINFGRELSFGQISETQKNKTSSELESGGSSDHSLFQRPGKSDSTEGYSNSNSLSLSESEGKTSQSHPSGDIRHQRGASIPKFGAWDEADPSSGVGFTVIFNKVKEEKQTASTKFPHYSSHTQTKTSQTSSSSVPESKPKFCCGLFSCARR